MINLQMAPMYDPVAVQPMRDELTYVGFKELITAEDVEMALENQQGTALVMVNSVCGCAAGSARPGVTESLQHSVIPDQLYTVFAGMEKAATERVRQFITGFPPSSPSIALFKDGKVVAMVERWMIEGRHPKEVSAILRNVYDEHCENVGPSISPEAYKDLVHAKACGSKIPKNPELEKN